MYDELTYWQRLWRVAIGIPTLFVVIFIIVSIGGTIGMSYIEWEWYWSVPRETFLGIYDWFYTMSAMGWRLFIPVYIGINFVVAWYWEVINDCFDDSDLKYK